MEPDILFNEAKGKFNAWYKFINKEKYNQDAYELFERAKNKYIMEKNISRIIECYEFMIQCLLHLKDAEFDLSQVYEDYADLLLKKRLDISKCLQLYEKAMSIQIDHGRFNTVLKIKEKLGDYYKSENQFDEAIKFYEEIKEQSDDNISTLMKISKILFELYVLNNSFEKGFLIYDDLCDKIESNLLKFSLNEIMLHSLFCLALHDEVQLDNKFNSYCDCNPQLINSRHFKLGKSLIESIKNHDLQLFEISVKDYDDLSKLTNVELKLLLGIKKKIDFEENSLS